MVICPGPGFGSGSSTTPSRPSPVEALVSAITFVATLDEAQAGDLGIAVTAMTAPLWQAAHPAETLTRLYAEESAMAHLGLTGLKCPARQASSDQRINASAGTYA